MAELLVGYAIGTAQIVLLDWLRHRVAHRRALRLYRSELQRLQAFEAKYRWLQGQRPPSDYIPKPPSLSSTFQSLVADLDWRLTDEHRDDDSALAAITIGDLCDTMQRYHALIQELLDRAERAESPEDRVHWSRAVEVAGKYDLEVDQFQYVINEALKDVKRRLGQARLFLQLWRLVVPLRRGVNPPPVNPSDSRVREFTERREREIARRGQPDA